jgi:hypothetical protein
MEGIPKLSVSSMKKMNRYVTLWRDVENDRFYVDDAKYEQRYSIRDVAQMLQEKNPHQLLRVSNPVLQQHLALVED